MLKLKSRFPQGVVNFLILSSVNIAYFTGFSGATALLIPQDGESVLYVSGTNFEQAKHEVKNARVELLKRGENLFQRISQEFEVSVRAKLSVDSIGIESWKSLANVVGGEEGLVMAGSVVRGLRAVKSYDELEFIREACRIADVGISTACEVVKPGVSEQEVVAEVEYVMRKRGSHGVAFNTIVTSGVNSAFPHGSCSSRTIMEGDLVIVDLGAMVRGYRSDVTRTIVAGKVSCRQQEIYGRVRVAQDLAIRSVRANVRAAAVDNVARESICREGFGDYFVHNVGHGVGLEIHEMPTLSPDSKDVLEAGNVVTVEPGIYIVDFGGVRIEDTVLVTEKGAEKLTNAAYLF
ncbi:MAG: Xaa-Pro peptidase family protein [Candidatus Bathyarchaeota archaeon]|nr:Xaa-Pro peptidase family protein [Candidatus Termiticorpusculum sp.]